MRKLNMGDVCAIPVDAKNYGLCQIARIVGKSLYLVIVFDIKLGINELGEFDPILLHEMPILAIVPASITDTRKIPLYWKTLINMPLVDCDLPMFIMPGTPNSNQGYSVIANFSLTHYRYIPSSQVEGMVGFFNCENRSIETLLYNRFIDSSIGENRRDLMHWHSNTIYESDMKKNLHEYTKWRGFGDSWEAYSKNILELEKLNELREADPIHASFMETYRNVHPSS